MNTDTDLPVSERAALGLVALAAAAIAWANYRPDRVEVTPKLAVLAAVAAAGVGLAVVYGVSRQRELRRAKRTVANITGAAKKMDRVRVRRFKFDGLRLVGWRMYVDGWNVPTDARDVVRDFRLNGWTVTISPHDGRIDAARREEEPLPTFDRLSVDEQPVGMGLRLGTIRDEEGKPAPAMWDPRYSDPHCLVTGSTGQGKSVMLNALISQAVAGGWQVFIADPKDSDTRWADRLPGVTRYGGDMAFLALDAAREELAVRQRWFAEHAKPTVTKLADIDSPDRPRPCLVVADEVVELLGLGEKRRQERTHAALGSLARLCRAQSMALCIALQRPDASKLGGEVRSNLGARVLCGKGTRHHLDMAFETQDVPPVDGGVRGRGRAQLGGRAVQEIQGAYVDPGEVLAAHGSTGA